MCLGNPLTFVIFDLTSRAVSTPEELLEERSVPTPSDVLRCLKPGIQDVFPLEGPRAHGPALQTLPVLMPASCDFGPLRRIAFFIIVALWLFTVPSAVTATASRGQPAVDLPQEAEPPQHRAASPVMTPSAVPPQNSDHYQAEHLGLPEFQADQPAAYQAPAADPKLSVDEHRVLDLSEEPFPSSEQYAAPAPQLPDCSTIDRLRKAQAVQPVPELVLLSTADGHVTAVDAHGQVVWRTDTGRPLLEASLKKITLNDNRGGGSATFIPSLDGSLYKFDGKQIEVVATADSVIYSSVKTDPWVLTGGRETKTFGIDPRTGEVR